MPIDLLPADNVPPLISIAAAILFLGVAPLLFIAVNSVRLGTSLRWRSLAHRRSGEAMSEPGDAVVHGQVALAVGATDDPPVRVEVHIQEHGKLGETKRIGRSWRFWSEPFDLLTAGGGYVRVDATRGVRLADLPSEVCSNYIDDGGREHVILEQTLTPGTSVYVEGRLDRAGGQEKERVDRSEAEPLVLRAPASGEIVVSIEDPAKRHSAESASRAALIVVAVLCTFALGYLGRTFFAETFFGETARAAVVEQTGHRVVLEVPQVGRIEREVYEEDRAELREGRDVLVQAVAGSPELTQTGAAPTLPGVVVGLPLLLWGVLLCTSRFLGHHLRRKAGRPLEEERVEESERSAPVETGAS